MEHGGPVNKRMPSLSLPIPVRTWRKSRAPRSSIVGSLTEEATNYRAGANGQIVLQAPRLLEPNVRAGVNLTEASYAN